MLRIANVADSGSAPNLIDPNPTFVSLSSARVILPWNAEGWRFNTHNLDATPDWKDPGFTPGPDWGTGSGSFGAETGAAMAAAHVHCHAAHSQQPERRIGTTRHHLLPQDH